MNKERIERIDRAWAELEKISQNGLHEVYKGKFVDFLYDWYPNFTWKTEESLEEMKAILKKPNFNEVRNGIKDKYDFNIEHDIKEAINENEKDLVLDKEKFID